MSSIGSYVPGALGLRAIRSGPAFEARKPTSPSAPPAGGGASSVSISVEARSRAVDGVDADPERPSQGQSQQPSPGIDPKWTVMAGLVEEMLGRTVTLPDPAKLGAAKPTISSPAPSAPQGATGTIEAKGSLTLDDGRTLTFDLGLKLDGQDASVARFEIDAPGLHGKL